MFTKVLPFSLYLISDTKIHCHISTNSWWPLLPWNIPVSTTVWITYIKIIIRLM